MNKAQKPWKKAPQMPTKAHLQVDEMRLEDAKRATKAKAKSKEERQKPQLGMPRVAFLAAAGLVKNKPGDVAKGFKGEITKKVVDKPYRYQNI